MSTIDEAPIIHGNISCGTVTIGPWNINEQGHIIPNSNASFDIGSAEYKVRHLYLSNNSLQIGDTALSEDTLKMNTRLINRSRIMKSQW